MQTTTGFNVLESKQQISSENIQKLQTYKEDLIRKEDELKTIPMPSKCANEDEKRICSSKRKALSAEIKTLRNMVLTDLHNAKNPNSPQLAPIMSSILIPSELPTAVNVTKKEYIASIANKTPEEQGKVLSNGIVTFLSTIERNLVNKDLYKELCNETSEDRKLLNNCCTDIINDLKEKKKDISKYVNPYSILGFIIVAPIAMTIVDKVASHYMNKPVETVVEIVKKNS